jgi:hypothetical protein
MTNDQAPMTNQCPSPNNQLELWNWSLIGQWGLVIGASRRVRYVVVALVICTAAGACADKNQPTSRPATARERQERALRDPFEVGRDEDMPSVSGGGTRDFDRKGFKRDVDRFWNP